VPFRGWSYRADLAVPVSSRAGVLNVEVSLDAMHGLLIINPTREAWPVQTWEEKTKVAADIAAA